jgi:hypothetical protein
MMIAIALPRRAMPLTDGDDEEHDHERVDDGRDRRREAGDDVPEGAEAAEDAEDAERPDHAQDGDGHAEGAEGEEGEEHHDGVDEVVAAAEEGREPVRVGVHRELGREDAREGRVRGVEEPAGVGEGAVRGDELAVELRLGGVDDEVLRAWGGARGAERVVKGAAARRDWGIGIGRRYQEDEERYDALEGHGLEDQPEFRLVPFETRQRFRLFPGLHCSRSEVLS